MLVDATDFVMRDWNDVAGTIASSNAGQLFRGARQVERLSAVYESISGQIPRSTSALTFATQRQCRERPCASIVPDGKSFTLRQHVSLLQLPDDWYKPRALDPRRRLFRTRVQGLRAADSGSRSKQHWIERHRLERVNPDDPNSPIKNPIVYYIDRGIPEPIRTATKQGVSWWIRGIRPRRAEGCVQSRRSS